MARAPDFKLPHRVKAATWISNLDHLIDAQGVTQLALTTEKRIETLFQIEDLCKHLRDLKMPLNVSDEFYKEPKRESLPKFKVKNSNDLNRIYKATQQLYDWWGHFIFLPPQNPPRVSFSPTIQIFHELFEFFSIKHLGIGDRYLYDHATKIAQEINERLELLPKQLRLQRQEQQKRLQLAKKHRDKIYNHLSSHLRYYGQLLVVRFDLAVMPNNTNPMHEEAPRTRDSFNDLESLIQKLISRRKPPHEILREPLGYLVKRQDLPEKGPHLHLILLFDAQRYNNKAFTVEKTIALCWQELAKQRNLQGLCWTTRTPQNRFSPHTRAAGILKWKDPVHKRDLQDLACYLGELDYYVKIEAPDNRNDLRHSHAPCRPRPRQRGKQPTRTRN